MTHPARDDDMSSTTTDESSSMASMFSRMIASRFTIGDVDSSSSQHAKTPTMPTIPAELELKIALVGGNGVGKTSIVRRWLKRPYQSAYSQTIGVDVSTLLYPYGPTKQPVKIQVWDVSSAEVDNTSLHELVCDDLDGIFFVFNVHRVSSIAAVDAWRTQLASFISSSEVPFYLLCHKADMLQKRVMTSDDIEAYARTAGYRGWSWTVGRMGLGESDRNPAVIEALDKMVDAICRSEPFEDLIKTRRAMASPPTMLLTPDAERFIESTPPCFSSAVLHVPTQAITTIPRSTSDIDDEPPSGFGANWMFGGMKGQYLEEKAPSEVDFAFHDVAPPRSEDDSLASPTIPTTSKDSDDDDGWTFFAGSIARHKAENILSARGEGAFLVRRKDSQTLVLSYNGADDIHHVLVEFHDGRYHIGSAKSSLNQPSFPTLAACLESIQRYAHKGIVFRRRQRFRVGEKPTASILLEPETTSAPRAPPRSAGKSDMVWRVSATESGSLPRLQAMQERLDVPPIQRLQVLTRDFYGRLRTRLRALLPKCSHEEATTIQELLAVALVEERENTVQDGRRTGLEDAWRKLVKDMESWNQILATLEITAP
ncbi:hypothetical protein SPRG_20327 [Saprolegnia parasitica CBS 223.65]|uniref:SH2 domain-containing protein n=1 Tax=Saprolegnia parasitica (strain CBS 223.65) TaxID=695850 RepID=A0A067CA49_SAPPC|nr:hypothetical protein SPRG_20327 [Saprolegnia parasitica CBS 223.65]KDO27373.1 hypothetical protein SPRG_20327 [Saprolegnia parasitica CBS 223.65]|eukprot:XP_012201941.1 hypothetical protein SPRG_20327 [Saprolegnia parasitica CBS 223.65]